nr:putative ribonuclease H-like domain-containing protein [Tanacetum cinerariifolium]
MHQGITAGEDSDFKDSIDQYVLVNLDDLFVDPTLKMFTDEQPPDYSFLSRFDVYPGDFLEIESDANFDDDSFDSKGEKIKEDDDLPSPDNEDKVFNPGILFHEKLVKIITRVAKEKKLAISYASLLFEDFDPPFYELLVFKEVPNSMRLLPFLSKNKEKVFKLGIYTSKKVHSYFLTELSHPEIRFYIDSKYSNKVSIIVVLDLSKFYGMKGIKRDFSVARTLQQNRVAKRKNRTLIEAARTMLADSLLPIPFWAEAVNTACCVQNRVLVTKPHNKTPYELLLCRSPSIGFMRPFGCLVTIINTLDPLGKFDGKAGNQPNDNAGIKENLDAGKVGKETVSAQRYVLIPLWFTGSQDPQNIDVDVADAAFDVKESKNDVHVSASGSDKTDNKKHNDKAKRDDKGKSLVDLSIGVRDLRAEFEEFSFNSTNKVNDFSANVNAAGPNPTNSTNSFNTASPSDTADSPNFRIAKKSSFVDPSKYPDDPDMPELEDIVYSDDKEDVGVEVNLSNLETNISVSPILTTRVHKDHPVTQIIGDLTSAAQIRSMTRMVKEQGGLNQINDEDFHTCMFACFLSQEEPKKVHQTLKDPSWIKAIQEEIIQFKMRKVWVLVDLPKGKRVIGFEDPDYPDNVYKVVKALYGLHQAPRA